MTPFLAAVSGNAFSTQGMNRMNRICAAFMRANPYPSIFSRGTTCLLSGFSQTVSSPFLRSSRISISFLLISSPAHEIRRRVRAHTDLLCILFIGDRIRFFMCIPRAETEYAGG